MTTHAHFAAALLDPARAVPDAVGKAARFAVYRNNVVVGLVDALAATYPAVLALVGEPFFRAAAREFVRAEPPRSPVLIDYGAAFPDWIAAFPPAAALPYLGDVARLEWAWNRAYNAADAAVVAAGALAAVPPDRLGGATLRLHPAVRLVESRYPVVSLWAEATGREDAGRLDLGHAETALVARPAEAVAVRRIEPATALFLHALGDGMPLGAAVAEASAAGGFELRTQIAALFEFGLVAGVDSGDLPARSPACSA